VVERLFFSFGELKKLVKVTNLSPVENLVSECDRIKNFLHMKVALISALFFSFLPLSAQEGGIEANRKLRTTVQKWISVMKEIQEKKKEGKEQKQILIDSKAALEAETKQLEVEIEAAEKRKAQLDEKSQDKLEKKETYDAAREALRAGLNRLEMKVSSVIPILPEELTSRDKVAKAISDHRGFVAKTDKDSLDLNARLTPMAAILSEAEKFNQIVTTFKGRTVTVGGKPVLLDGIYFGLAMGFAADNSGQKAILLKPGPKGWTETEISDVEVAAQVRELIEVGMGTGEIRLIDLPLEIAK